MTAINALWVLPSVDSAWGRECRDTLAVARVLFVDNSAPGENTGVTVPWNLGRAAVLGGDLDYLVVCSESLRFGAPGGRDFEECLDGSDLVLSTCAGFHLTAISAMALARVGAFDENLPTYGSDRDYLVRLTLAGFASPGYNDGHVPQASVDVAELTVAHSITEGLVTVDFGAMQSYLDAKWGDPAPGLHFGRPFDDPGRDWTWWPEVVPVSV